MYAKPAGGGLLPTDIPAIHATDAWGNAYGYCVWDHGATIDDASCGGGICDYMLLKDGAKLDQFILQLHSNF